MAFVSEIEAVALQSGLEPVDVIDEKHGVVNGVFLAEFTQKDLRQCGRERRERANVEESVCIGIDRTASTADY